MGPPNKQLIKKKVNPRKTITNKQSGIDGPSKTVKKYDASDFSTSKRNTKKDMLAIKASPKKSAKGMKNTFKDDTTAKRKLKNTFKDDTTAKRTPKKDTSDFAVNKKKTKTVKAPGGGPTTKPKARISALAAKDRKKNKKTPPTSVDSASFKSKPKRERGPKVSVPGSMKDGPPQKVGTTKQKKVGTTKQKKLSFFEKIMSDTKKNFSGNFKKGTGRYKSISTGKTNFNKKKKKLPKQISV